MRQECCAEMLEIVWRVSYAIITAIIGFMLLWRIFGLKENAHFAKRSQGALHPPPEDLLCSALHNDSLAAHSVILPRF